MQRCIIDRLEGDIAVCELEDGSMVDTPLSSLPEGVREGDCLVRVDGLWHIDSERTATRKTRIAKLAESLFAD